MSTQERCPQGSIEPQVVEQGGAEESCREGGARGEGEEEGGLLPECEVREEVKQAVLFVISFSPLSHEHVAQAWHMKSTHKQQAISSLELHFTFPPPAGLIQRHVHYMCLHSPYARIAAKAFSRIIFQDEHLSEGGRCGCSHACFFSAYLS